jgi:transposase
VTRQTVVTWRARYVADGLDGLSDRKHPGRPRALDPLEFVVRTMEGPPQKLGATHWSSRLLTAELGVSNVAVANIRRARGLQPRRSESFKFSTDPQLDAKVRDVVGLYLAPPA